MLSRLNDMNEDIAQIAWRPRTTESQLTYKKKNLQKNIFLDT